MINEAYEYVVTFKFNSELGIMLYWFPLVFCTYGYLIRTYHNLQNDKKVRDGQSANGYGYYGTYTPTDSVGTLLGRALVTVTPVLNMFVAVFDLLPDVFKRVFDILEKLFDFPLVPDNQTFAAKRKLLEDQRTSARKTQKEQ